MFIVWEEYILNKIIIKNRFPLLQLLAFHIMLALRKFSYVMKATVHAYLRQ